MELELHASGEFYLLNSNCYLPPLSIVAAPSIDVRIPGQNKTPKVLLSHMDIPTIVIPTSQNCNIGVISSLLTSNAEIEQHA
jgi:hypothetical protein